MLGFARASKPQNPQSQAERRRARLAEELRPNLQKRKAQTRSRRTGEADERPEGLGAAGAKPGDGAKT